MPRFKSARRFKLVRGRRPSPVEQLEARMLLTASVSGTVFNDLDGDGTNYGPYFGLSGWRVYADLNNNGGYDAGEPTALTSSVGAYTLSGLAAGSYTIRDVVQTSWYASTPAGGSRSISLTNGQTLIGQDFGNAQYGSISGTLFNDQNGNGTRDAGEPPLPGFQVYMDLNGDYLPDTGDVIATADANGHYAFNNLRIATYTVLAVPVNGWQQSGVTAASFQFSSGANFTTDWAFTQKLVVRGQVFADNDNNGTFTNGDTSLSGWTVYADLNNDGFFDAGEPSVVTDANGLYQIGLTPGTYTIREVPQGGYHPSAPAGGSYTVTATTASVFFGKNFANVQASAPASISGYLYNDIDGTGTTTSFFNVLSNWRVYLDTNNNGHYDPGEPTALSDSNGFYTISGVTPGAYTLRDVLPSGWYATTPASGSLSLSVGSGQSLTGQTFYNAQYETISGTLYDDVNGDGIRESSEPALAGDRLFIDMNGDGVFDAGDLVATSDSTGHYAFNTLPIGSHFVQWVPVPGWQPSYPAGAGINGESGSNFFQDWGLTQKSIVRGLVYVDNNSDGVFDEGDTVPSGWTVYADLNNNGTLDPGEPTTTQMPTGFYLLGVSPGSYTVRLAMQNGYALTEPGTGSYSVTVGSLGSVSGIDFGVAPVPVGGFGGMVFDDQNGDGVYESDVDLPAVGATVYADLNGNGQPDPGEPAAVTDASGNYQINNLPANASYIVRVVPAPGVNSGTWVQTFPQDDGPQYVYVSPDFVTGGISFGVQNTVQPASLSGIVFNDTNADGIYEPGLGETPRGGVTVYADLNNNSVRDPGEPTAISDPVTGQYQLSLDSTGPVPVRLDLTATSLIPTDPFTWNASAGTNTSQNLGLTRPASIFGFVYDDLNHNGIKDAGEPAAQPSHGVVFADYNHNGLLDPGEPSDSQYNSNGQYMLGGLLPGSYNVVYLPPSGFARTGPVATPPAVVITSGGLWTGPTFGDIQISSVPMDFNYLLTLAQHYGQQGTFATGDLNDDGQVNFNDLLLLAQNYGHPLPSAAAAQPVAASADALWLAALRKPRRRA